MDTIKNFVSFAETLNDAYKARAKKISTFNKSMTPSTIRAVTKFSKDDINSISLPYTCHGRLISIGEFFDSTVGENVILDEEALRASLSKWRVPIMKSHAVTEALSENGYPSIDNIVGEVIQPVWGNGGIDWQGSIGDLDIARKIGMSLIKFGSVTFTRDIERREDGRLYYTNITPLDFSLVFRPKDKHASIREGGL